MAPSSKTNKKTAEAPPKKEEKMVNPPPKSTPETKADEATTTTALATKAASSMALMGDAPEWLKKQMEGRSAEGFEKMDTADMILPRLVLMQSIMKEVMEGNFKAGDIVDNISRQVVCPAGESFPIIPISLAKSRIMFEDMADGGGVLCRADDALKARPNGKGMDEGGKSTDDCSRCVHSKWDDTAEKMKDRKPACTLFYNIVCLLPERGYLPYVWSLKTTSVPVAKRFLTAGKQTGADMFAMKFRISTVLEKGEQFTYQNFEFSPGEWVSEAEYRKAKEFHEGMKGKTWAPSTEDLDKEVAAEDAAEDADVDPAGGEPDTSFPPPKEEKVVNAPPPPRTAAKDAKPTEPEGEDGF